LSTSAQLSDKVRLERDGFVATVTLDNPGRRNACSMGMWLAIRDTFRDLATSDARVVILTGANGDFCSGADLSGGDEPDSGWEGNKVNGMRRLAGAVMAVHECPLPVIAKVDGVAVGAGFGLAMAADMLFCSERARFSAIFAKLGLSLDFGTSWFLAQRVGIHRAKEIALTAEMMDATRADALGLLNGVVATADLDAKVAQVAARIAAGPPIALSITKRMLTNAVNSSLASALETETLAQNVNIGTTDMAEAMMAYHEKRTPVFRGE
jgi:2-(1,2-epoxy-1,2-dihydrophenyl)acetyl-CoA isomerase